MRRYHSHSQWPFIKKILARAKYVWSYMWKMVSLVLDSFCRMLTPLFLHVWGPLAAALMLDMLCRHLLSFRLIAGYNRQAAESLPRPGSVQAGPTFLFYVFIIRQCAVFKCTFSNIMAMILYTCVHGKCSTCKPFAAASAITNQNTQQLSFITYNNH